MISTYVKNMQEMAAVQDTHPACSESTHTYYKNMYIIQFPKPEEVHNPLNFKGHAHSFSDHAFGSVSISANLAGIYSADWRS
jgi:hypothetical protein